VRISLTLDQNIIFMRAEIAQYSNGLWAEKPEFETLQGQDISLHSTESRPVPIGWVQEALSHG
jgi:hypothetical protein